MDESTSLAVSDVPPTFRWFSYATGLTPLAIELFPTEIGPLDPWNPPVPFIGIPLQEAVFGIAMILMIAGLLLIGRARSVLGVLVAIFACTIPSLILTMFAVQIILVVKNAF